MVKEKGGFSLSWRNFLGERLNSVHCNRHFLRGESDMPAANDSPAEPESRFSSKQQEEDSQEHEEESSEQGGSGEIGGMGGAVSGELEKRSNTPRLWSQLRLVRLLSAGGSAVGSTDTCI